MGRLKLQMQITIDGRNPDGENDELSWEDVRVYSEDLLDTADTIVLGRKTAVDFIPHWNDAATKHEDTWHRVATQISQARKVVFSKTLENPGWNNSEIERGDLVDAIARLKAGNEKNIIVYGGVSFVSSLVDARLIDEYHLLVNPVARGRGRSIFDGMEQALKLRLKRAIGFDSGHVLLHYE
jgi:dihydrofolate reductase